MDSINISVEVHCAKAPWALLNSNSKYNSVDYRIFVNDYLITERSWHWNNSCFLKENMWVENHSQQYEVRIQPVLLTDSQAVFYLKNLHITNRRYQTEIAETQSIRLRLV